MSIFKTQRKEQIIIIGCGSFGSALATMLDEQNKRVTIIDIDENAFAKLSPCFKGFSIVGDGTDVDLLELAGVANAAILVAITNNDAINIMIAQIAKQVFHVKNVITQIYDTTKQTAYNNMDIISLCPIQLIINEYKRIILNKEDDSL